MGSILKLLFLLGCIWALYTYGIEQRSPDKISARYQDEEPTYAADEDIEDLTGTDECQRYINADRIQDCLETRIEQAAKKRSP